jgi:hypothetical protein
MTKGKAKKTKASRLSRFLVHAQPKDLPDHRMGHFRTRTIAHMKTSSGAPLKGGRGKYAAVDSQGRHAVCAHKKWAFAG